MPKIIGLINSWYSEKWIAASIEQALLYCDEVIVAIGPHSVALAGLEDRTREIAETYSDRVTLIKASMSYFYDRSRADTLNRMLSVSKLRKQGNWVWILDVDEFYFECSYNKIMEAISSGMYTHMKVEEKFFLINTTRYLLGTHGRLFKIGSIGDGFRPTQHWTGVKTKEYVLRRDDGEMGMFHYSLLTNTSYRKIMWESSYSYDQPNKLQWLSDVYTPYDLENEELWITKNQKLFGVKSPWFAKEMKADKDGKLFVYNGPHPKLVEKAGITTIQDFRKV